MKSMTYQESGSFNTGFHGVRVLDDPALLLECLRAIGSQSANAQIGIMTQMNNPPRQLCVVTFEKGTESNAPRVAKTARTTV